MNRKYDNTKRAKKKKDYSQDLNSTPELTTTESNTAKTTTLLKRTFK